MEPVSETARLLGIDLEWWILGVGLLTLVAGLWVAVVQHLIWRRPATHIAFSDEWEINGPIDDRRVEVSADVAALGRVMVASARAYLCIGFRDRVLLERMFDQVGKAWEGERIGFMFRIPKDYGACLIGLKAMTG